MNAIASVLIAVLAQVASPPAAPQAKVKAQALLKEGTALYERGDFAGALEKFELAYGVYASPKLLFNMAQADRDLGRPVDALEAFEKFLALAPDAAPDVLSEARRSVAELRGKLGQLQIECAVPGVQIALDGTPIGVTPLSKPIWTVPGHHQVAVRERRYAPESEDVNVVPGETQLVRIPIRELSVSGTDPLSSLVTAPSAPTSVDSQAVVVPNHRENWWSGRKWYVWTGGAVTVALAAAAIVAGLATDSRFDDLRQSCGGAGCPESDINGVKARALATNVLWGLTGISAIATGALFYFNGREGSVSLALRF